MSIDTVFPYDAVYTVDSGFSFRVLDGDGGGSATVFEIDANSKTMTLYGSIKKNGDHNIGSYTSSGDLVSFQSQGTEKARIEHAGRGGFEDGSVLIPVFTDWPDQKHPQLGSVPDGTMWLNDAHHVRRLFVAIGGTAYYTDTF